MAKDNFNAWLEEELADPESRAEWDETMPAAEFGLAVARSRDARGMTQEALAAATGVSRPMITRIEGGDQAPTMTTVLKFVRAFDARLEIEPSGRMAFVAAHPVNPETPVTA